MKSLCTAEGRNNIKEQVGILRRAAQNAEVPVIECMAFAA